MEKTELTSKVFNGSTVNDFQKNHTPSCCVTSASQLQLKTTSYDINDTDHMEPETSNCDFQNGDQLVPGNSSGALENSDQSELSNDIDNKNQIVHETSYNDFQAIDQIVPSEASSCDMENYDLSDISNENMEISHWLETSQNDFEENASNELGTPINDRLMTLISNGDGDNIDQFETSHIHLENMALILLEASNNHHQMPIASNDHLKNSDHIVPGALGGDITEHLRPGHENNATNRNNSQLLPEIPGGKIELNGQFVPEITVGNMNNNDHVSEASSFGKNYNDQPILNSSDLRSNLKSEPKLTDFIEENELSNFQLLSSCMRELNLFDFISDTQSELTELGLSNGINDQLKPELSCIDQPLTYETSNYKMRNAGQSRPEIQDSNLNIDTPSNYEMRNAGQSSPEIQDSNLNIDAPSNYEMRNAGQSSPEIQDSNLNIDAPSSSETSDSSGRNYNQQKSVCSEEKLVSNYEHSEVGPSVHYHDYITPTDCVDSEQLPRSCLCEGNNFSQSSNLPVLPGAPSYGSNNCESITFSQTSNAQQYLHPILPECQLTSFTENSFDSSTPSMIPIYDALEKHTERDSVQCKQSDFQQICPDKDGVQYRQCESVKIWQDFDILQHKQSENQNIYPEIDISQCNQDEYHTKISSVRQRAVLKSPIMKDSSNSKPLSSSEADKSIFGMLVKNVLALFVLTLVVLTATYAVIFKSSDRINNSPLNTFIGHVSNIKQTFPSQSEHLWKTVRASAFSVFNKDESKQPAVIIVASSTQQASVASCITKYISAGFESSWDLSPNISVVDINNLKHLDTADQKLQLDVSLNSVFGIHKRRSLIIENLQLLDPKAALLFYSYCDTDNAPFKDVMILLTLYFDEKEVGVQSSGTVERYLENRWRKSLTLDKLKPLLNRVASSIVIVKEEHSGSLYDLCS